MVVGAGPVGMTLALDLGSRGVPVVVLEQSLHTTGNPRCNTTNARSMEYLRRLGIADRIRRAGLPGDHPTDAVYTTSIHGHELTRFRFSSSDEVFAGTAPEAADWPTPELQHRISQIYLEPILADELARLPSVRVQRGIRVTGCTQDADGVTVHGTDTTTGEPVVRTGAYVIGCDGGASTVRRAMGARFEGDPRVGDRRMSIHFRSTELTMPGPRPGWWYWWHGEHHRGAFMQLDGRSEYVCHARVPDGQDLDTADPELALREAIGRDVEHEVLGVVRWTPRRLIADTFRTGRMLLAGDAAHIWVNLGGFGMNAGIADAIGLGWRLAALHHGWGSPALLDHYDLERRSVGTATSRAAASIGNYIEDALADPVLRTDTPAGAALRARTGARLQEIDRQQWYSTGIQLGTRYTGSPGIADDDHPGTDTDTGGPAAAAGDPTRNTGTTASTGADGTGRTAPGAMGSYLPGVEPGARLPHHRLADGGVVFDRLGPDLTLLRIGPDAPAGHGLVDAAAELGVPLTVVTLPAEAARSYSRPLVLVRPDMHVAWSGSAGPDRPAALLARLCAREQPVRA